MLEMDQMISLIFLLLTTARQKRKRRQIFETIMLKTEDLILRWFEKKYPDEPVQAVYYSIYF